jgi:hypothetical protein
MGTLNAMYIRCSEPGKIADLRAAYPTVYTEPGTDFWGVDHLPTRFQPPETELASLSARLRTDVLWLSFQSVTDAFGYQHWQNGQCPRLLAYGCFEQGLWERVEGKQEPWERAAFFDPRHLARHLEDASDDEAVALNHLWRRGEIVRGRHDPIVDARESARKVAEFYRLPDWGIELTARA